MRVDLLTKEYPPAVYGGAGVHVTELVKALRRSIEVQVRCFGAPRDEADTTAYEVPDSLADANGALQTLAVDLQIADAVAGTELVHSHTWYANEAGRLAQELHDVPHVVSAHSLEPLRPWKAEQLGGGYRISSDIERRAYEAADRVIAVSNGMRADILRSYPALDPERVVTIYNGIDLESWAPNPDADRARELGLDPEHPSVVFVGRITRQKGLPHLLRAARALPDDVQLILCAGAPDTPEIMAEVKGLVQELQSTREGVVWIDEVLPREDMRALLTHATTFVCPSVYEPLGIVNLEAMACGAPVVGSGTGGIPEVIDDGVTGFVVPIDQVQDGTGAPTDPERYEADLADALTRMVADPEAAKRMGEAGRERARTHFDWGRIADETRELYATVIAERAAAAE